MKMSVRTSLLLPCLAVAAYSNALSLTNVSANPVITRPTSGAVYATVFGTLTSTTPGEMASFSMDGARRADGLMLPVAGFRDYRPEVAAALLASGSYTGPLIQYAITPATELGVYDRALDLALPSQVRFFSSVTNQPVSTDYSITVQAVPEPTSFAAFGLGALGLLRRRKARA